MDRLLPAALETGVGWQDTQHRELYKRIVDLVIAIDERVVQNEAVRLLDFLDEYVVVHFHDEERAMGDSDFPEIVTHIEAHHRFIEELDTLRGAVDKNPDNPELSTMVHEKVLDWIENHIAVNDKELGQYLLKSSNAAVPGGA